MRDLVKLSEPTITRVVESGLSDFDQVEPGILVFRATCTLGHASLLCSEKISTNTLRILQGFLLDWESFPASIKTTREIQGAAITVLGQQALRDRDIAKEMTPIFGKILRDASRSTKNRNDRIASGAAVTINAAKALGDISVRFTALVEPYLPDMCISMKNSNTQVRQVILVIFIQLLVEDFIKINGPFFFHILTMLSDNDTTIREMTVFLIKERLLAKNKSLITQQFVQSIFHFNDYHRRIGASTNKKMGENERKALTLPGEKNAEKRRAIYDFMLQHVDAPGKLTILVTITRQILNVRNGAKRSEMGQGEAEVIRDAVYIVSSEYLQPASCCRNVVDDDNPEESARPVVTTGNLATNLIAEGMKKHRLNVLLPCLLELKRFLAHLKITFVDDVTRIFLRILADHSKDQLGSLYNEYPRLDKEIERDKR